MSLEIATVTDLAAPYALRRKVFIEEQQVSEVDELDGLDAVSRHFLARLDGDPVGTLRLIMEPPMAALPAGILGTAPVIGRVCVLPEWRGRGIGAALIRAAMADLRERGGVSHVRLAAQTRAIGFYENLGFAVYGEGFDDAGIDHRWMQARL